MEIAYAEALKGSTGKMTPRRSIIAPNRLENLGWDLIAAFAHCRGDYALESLRDRLRQLTGREHIFFAPSGRCAIAQVLSLLPQREVVMPALTCPAVKTAAEVAGKRIIYVDIQRTTLNASSADFASAAAAGRILLPTHLFGIPTDIEQICELARKRGCPTIEDAAAAFPARAGGRTLGTTADIGIISFESSKRVPSFRGAAIIVNNENLLDLKKLAFHRVVATTAAIPIWEAVHSVLYKLATVPWIYGRVTLPRKLEFYRSLAREQTVSLPRSTKGDEFYCREFHPYQAALVLQILARIDGIREHIQRLVSVYQEVCSKMAIETFNPPDCDTAGLLKFPIFLQGTNRANVLRTALKHGLVLDTNFERPLAPETAAEAFPVSSWAAQNLILLPLYKALSVEAAERLMWEVVDVQRTIASIGNRA